MNFRSYNHLLEFRSRDGRHAAHSPSVREGLPGVIRGLPGGIREVCGSGHAAQPEASGGISPGTRVHSVFGASGRAYLPGYSGTSVAFGKHSEGGRKFYRIVSRLELRDAWRTRTTSGK